MKKLMALMLIMSFISQQMNADTEDILGPTIAGAALGGIFGGGRGAAIGAGVGFGVGALNSSARERERRRRRYYRYEPYYEEEYYEPYYDDPYYYESPSGRRYRRRYIVRENAPVKRQRIIQEKG